MKKIPVIIFFFAAVLMAACSSDEQFRVSGTVEGNPTMNMRAGYYADGVYKTVITAVREGKFEFTGIAPQPTVLELMDYDYHPLVRLYVKNGDTYDVRMNVQDIYDVDISGNSECSRWSAFLRNNAEKLRKDANNTIAAYIDAHRDDIVSTLLLMTSFDASEAAEEADSLMSLIAPEARPSSVTEAYMYVLDRLVSEAAMSPVLPMKYIDSKDSLQSFNPSRQGMTLISVSRQSDYRRDSIVPALRRLSKEHNSKKLAIIDFSLDNDTAAWKRAARADSATWKQGWAAGGLASMPLKALGLPSVPYAVVCDSAGVQLLRTRSVGQAEAFINAQLK
jgi:hypothetical protein